MRYARLATMLLTLCILNAGYQAHAQTAPVCDGSLCTPNTGSPSYGGAAIARAKSLNARGHSSRTVVMSPLPAIAPAIKGNDAIVGSQSYNYVIPVLRLPGRAGMDLVLNLYYNSRIWDVDTVNNTITFNADRDFPSYGFRLDFGYVEKTPSGEYILTEGDGTKRVFATSSLGGLVTTDGSWIGYEPTSRVLTYKNGVTVQYEAFPSNANLSRPVWIKDTNGNYFSIAYVAGHDQKISAMSDTLGRVIWFHYNPDGNPDYLYQNVAVSANDPAGVHTWVTFSWANIYGSGYAWYNFSGLAVNAAPALSSALTVLSGCTYPNGTGYRFTYGDWGIINKIEHLSASGAARSYVSYNYPAASTALTDAPAYTAQTVSPDGASPSASTWNYAVAKAGTGIVTSMTVTDPLGNSSVTSLDSTSGLLSSIQFKNNANIAQKTLNYAWTTSDVSTVIGSVTTTLNDTGQQSKIQYAYDPFYANITDVYEYDWGLQLKRHTVTSYMTTYLTGLPTQVLVKDAAGNTVARTDMAYDGSGTTSITGAANHDDTAFGSGFTHRGNLTSLTRYANAAAGTGAVTRSFTYDSLGNLRTAQLDCCNQKAFNFSSGTQYAYPDSVVRGISPQFTSGATYNTDFGLVATGTDENGQVTQYQYDSMMRVTRVTLPPQNGSSLQLSTAFDDNSAAPSVTNSASSTTGAAVNLPVTVTTIDGLGHTTQVDTKNGTTVVSSVKYQYDQIWRRLKTSNPFAPGETTVYTTLAYDALGRVKQVTPPSGGFTRFDYLGNAVTVTDPAGKQRKNFTDALGRLVEVDEPGWGDALKSSGSVTISGNENSFCPLDTGCISAGQYIYDTGTVKITVNGLDKSVSYGHGSSSSTIAVALANAINADTSYPATAAVSGTSVILTSRAAGAGVNYSLSASSSTNDPADFGGPSFTGTPSGPTLAGGQDAVSPDAPSLSRPLQTTYGYDLLDHLTSASQGALGLLNGSPVPGQPRSYAYDGLGRLTSSSTPESGTVTNFYTTSGGGACAGNPMLVCRIQDARGTVKTLSYEGINRLSGVSYSDGTPAVTYSYDSGTFALDRLTGITEGANSQTFTYDNLGQIKSVDNLIGATHYVLQYGYDSAGQLASITYPSGRVVNQTPDGMGRLASVADGVTTYMNGLAYNAAGEATAFNLGNGVQGQFGYNDHLQIASLRYFKAGSSQDLLNLGYDYGTANNGQIQTVHYYTSPGVEDLTKSESFTYDAWSRLKTAQTLTVSASIPGTWGLQWGYDRLGNRLQQLLTGGNVSIGQPQFTVDISTNRISGYGYDAAGNLTSDGVNTYTYDGASRLSQINGGSAAYTYFGALRIKKITGSGTTIYVYSGSKPVAEYAPGAALTSPSKEYVYAGSQLLATVTSTSITYHHPDHLSNRAETDSSGNLVRSFGHFPYGETWYESAADKDKFTTYERDSSAGETGLDYAIFRQYASGQGRFMNADLLAGSPWIPQSLNRYAYTSNDPINLVDPLGLCGITTVTTTEYDHEGHVKSKTTTIHDEGPCPANDGGTGGPAAPAPGPAGGGGVIITITKPLTPQQQQCIQDELKYAERVRRDSINSEPNQLLKAMGKGFLRGAKLGATLGFAGGEIVGGPETGGLSGITGALLGGLVGGVLGAGDGAVEDSFYDQLTQVYNDNFTFANNLQNNIRDNCGVNVTVTGHP